MYSLDEQLIVALKKKNYALADSLVAQGANLNAINARGESPVFFFATTHTQEALKWLIDKGANVDIPNKLGQTALFSAVERNELVPVDILLNAGADVNIRNGRKITPLMQTVLSEKQVGVFERLMQANPDLDCTTESGTTPVLAAAARGKTAYVSALLDAGADPEACDYLGQGLLHAAISSRDPQMLAVVLEKAPLLDPNYAARSGSTAMSETLGSAPMVKMLLDIGGDPNARSANRMNEGMTLLMGILGQQAPNLPFKKKKGEDDLSAQIQMMMGGGGGGEDLVREMLQKGARLDTRDDRGQNAAYYAFQAGATQFFQVLMPFGFDPTRPMDPSSMLPYDLMASPNIDHENPDALQLVEDWHSMGFPFVRPAWDEAIDGKMTKTMADTHRDMPTVLQSFAAVSWWDGLEKALSLGAPINEKGPNGSTLAHLLVRMKVDGMSSTIKQALALASRAKNIDPATKEQQLQEIKDEAKAKLDSLRTLLNQYTINWNAQDEKGNTPLHLAAQNGSLEWASYLVQDMQVACDVKNNEGLTPAALALKGGNLPLFHVLSELAQEKGLNVRQDALLSTTLASDDDFRARQPWLQAIASYDWKPEELEAKDEEGRTPLYIAAATDQHDVVRTLLRMKANPNAQNQAGNTALMEATFKESGEVMRLLRAAGASPTLSNEQGMNAVDVAKYVKTPYVQNALNDDDLMHLVQELYVSPPSPAQKIQKERFQLSLDNAVRQAKGEAVVPLPELTEEEKKIFEEEQIQQQQQQQQRQAALTPATGAAMTAPRSPSNPKVP